MTKNEFMHLYAIPVDIRRRRKRIDRLTTLLEQNEVTDTVLSSTDMGTATTNGHATITGIVGGELWVTELKALKSDLKALNDRLSKEYPVAVKLIETCENPALRVALDARCLCGESWESIAAQTGTGTGDMWRHQVGNWIDSNLKKV